MFKSRLSVVLLPAVVICCKDKLPDRMYGANIAAVSSLFNLIAFKLSIPFWRQALVDRVVVSEAIAGKIILPLLSAVIPFTLNTSLPEVSAKFLSLSVVKLAKFNL